MKKLLILFAFLFSNICLFAQTSFIEGQQEIFICDQQCYDYAYVNVIQGASYDDINWYLSDPNLGSIFIDPNDSTLISICFNPQIWQSEAFLHIEASGSGANGATFDSHDSLQLFFIQTFETAIITHQDCNGVVHTTDSLSGCFDACENTTETYIVSGDYEGRWLVFGAESYVDNGLSVDVTWGSAGLGSISFEVYNSQCVEVIDACVDIKKRPKSEFIAETYGYADTITVCKNQIIYFENLSNGADHFLWTFGDGDQSEEFHTQHAYSQEGYYTVELNAYRKCQECNASSIMVVEVLPAAAPELSCQATVCPGIRQKYTAITDGCQVFNWNISSNGRLLAGGDSDDDFIDVVWESGPEGIIELSVSSCSSPYCNSVATFKVPVISTDGPVEGDTEVCANELTTYTAPSFPGATYNWSLNGLGNIVSGQGTNAVSVQWGNTSSILTNQIVSVTYNHCYHNCGGSDDISVSITPNLFVAGDRNVCMDNEGSFSATAGFQTNQPTSVNWTIEDAEGNTVFTASSPSENFTHTMSYAPGEYIVVANVLDVTQFCVSEFRYDFNISELPQIPLGIVGDSVICPGTEYAYTVEPAGEFNTTWEVIDGTNTVTYEGNICRHTFGNTPPYEVRAYHVDIVFPACLSDAFVKELRTGGSQVITGKDEACLEDTEIYSVNAVGGATYQWEISPAEMGNITDNGLETVEVFWTQSGNATLTLDICGEQISFPVLIRPLPQFTVDHPDGLCEYDNAMISTNPSFSSYQWLSEEYDTIAQTSTLEAGYGHYGVQVTDQFGCSEKQNFGIQAYPSPVAKISSPGNLGVCDFSAPVELHAATDGIDYSFQWYKDGLPIGSDQPIYEANDFGYYYVEVTNGENCSTRSRSLRVFDFCDNDGIGVCDTFTCQPRCAFYGDSLMISATNSSACNIFDYELLNSNVDSNSITWLLQNEQDVYIELSGNPVSKTYFEPGYYTVGVRARINGFSYPMADCYHYKYQKILVPLTADFIADNICTGETVTFHNKTTFFPGDGIASVEWDFDDPSSGSANTSTDLNPNHVFTSSGTYNVKLRATSLSGCVSERELRVYAAPLPSPEITSVTDACEDQPVRFSVVDTLYDYQWDFGDASSPVGNNDAVVADVRHAFDNAGNYNVMVTATSVYGCVGSEQASIEIHENTLAGTIDADPSLDICQGDSVLLTANVPDATSYLWNTKETGDEIQVKESGHYSVQVQDDLGCQYIPDPVFLQVVPKPEVTLRARVITGSGAYGDWTENLEACFGTEIEVAALGSGDLSYVWSNSETTQIIDFTIEGSDLLTPGTHTFNVNVSDNATGCSGDEKSITIVIRELPNTPAIAMTSGTGCAFSENVLEVTNVQNNVTYIWSDGQTGPSITVSEEGNYTVEATNQFGCKMASNSDLAILNTPDITLFPTGCFIDCSPAEICIPNIQNAASYEIFLNNAVHVSGTGSPGNFTATESGDYHINLVGFNGCSSASDILSLDLYPGLGEIITTVYEDVNQDGMVDDSDIPLENIPVWVTDDMSTMFDKAFTDVDGMVSFPQMPQLSYIVHFGDMLSPVYRAVIDSVSAEVVSCDQVINIELLVTRNCSVDGDPQSFVMCPGDSITVGDTTFYDLGMHTAVLDASNGCDSLIEVTITEATEGFTSITVYLDMNSDGAIDAGDSLLAGIPVQLVNVNNQVDGTTDVNGNAVLTAMVETWTARIDTSLISGYRYPYYQEQSFLLDACDTVEIEFLLAPDCPIDITNDFVTICPGDSILIAGNYYQAGVHLVGLPNGICDSLVEYNIVDSFATGYTVNWTPACMGQANGTISVQTQDDDAQIVWTHDNSMDFNLFDLPAGTYEFTLTSNSCSVIGEVIVEEISIPMPAFDVAGPTCPNTQNGRIILTNYQDGDLWTVNGEVQSSAVKSNLAPGEYFVEVGEAPCSVKDTLVIEESDVLPVGLPQDLVVPQNTSVDIIHNYMDSVDLQYIWEPQDLLTCDDCSNPSFIGSDEGVFLSVSVITSAGCVLTDSAWIQVDSAAIVFLPTAFSPDANNVNDRFLAYPNDEIVAIKKLQIFNRWGERLYAEERIDGKDFIGWDGNRSEEPSPEGIYMYLVDIVFKNGKEEVRQGEFYLFR